MCRVDANVVQHKAGILNDLHMQCVQEENPNVQAQALPARESQCAKARNFWQAGEHIPMRHGANHHVVGQWLGRTDWKFENGGPSSSTPTRKRSI